MGARCWPKTALDPQMFQQERQPRQTPSLQAKVNLSMAIGNAMLCLRST